MPEPARLKRKWGQHHLTQGSLCRPLVEFLRPEGLSVVEIGPGGGVLTAELLAAGALVTAWEIDLDWALRLPRRPDLSVVVGDALELPWARFPESILVAGNLPYNVATALIGRMLAPGTRCVAAAVMVQWEVGRRLGASPGGRAYAASSVLTQARAEVTLLGRVAKGAFRPPPKVDAALVGLTPRARVADDSWPAFRAVVLQAFAERRKTVRNSLASGWGRRRAEAALEAAGIDGGRRSETLAAAELASLAEAAGRLGVVAADGTIAADQEALRRPAS